MIARFVLILSLVWCTPALASPQCDVAAEAATVLSLMQNVGLNGGEITLRQSADLGALVQRADLDARLGILAETPAAASLPAIREAYVYAQAAVTVAEGGVDTLGFLASGDVQAMIDVGLAGLAAMDCATPAVDPIDEGQPGDVSVPEGAAPGAVHVLPQTVPNQPIAASPVEITPVFRDYLVAFSSLCIALIIWSSWRIWTDRQAKMRRRYLCDIPVQVSETTAKTRPIVTRLVDISRAGVKIAIADLPVKPTVGSVLALRFAGRERQLTVRWRNASYLGGLFDRPFSEGGLSRVLSDSRQKGAVLNRDPKHRDNEERRPAGRRPSAQERA